MKKWLLTMILPIFIAAGCSFTCGYFVGRTTVPYSLTVQKLPEKTEIIEVKAEPEPKLVSADISEAVQVEAQEEVHIININTATEEELTELQGIGEKTAAKIVAYREENGGFSSIEEIMKVSGIGKKKFEQIKDMITV